jgi:Holliday junction resolvasome RuvABC endonuclease subunit
MIVIPADASDRAKLVGIDPGSDKLGVAFIEFSCVDFRIYSCGAQTLVGSKLPRGSWIAQMYSDRYSRIRALEEELVETFDELCPLIIASEAPFINVRRPAAYGALVEVVAAVQSAVHQHSPWRVLALVSPSQVKQAIGAPGNADKDVVKKHILQVDELTSTCISPLAQLDEHSIDALAVSYYTLKQYRNSDIPRSEI